MPPLCPGFGHQSTGRAGGNYFRFWPLTKSVDLPRRRVGHAWKQAPHDMIDVQMNYWRGGKHSRLTLLGECFEIGSAITFDQQP
jgi:hypothetical protein